MDDIMKFSPLWGEWHIKELVGKGTFGSVYRAEKKEYGNTYESAIKHLQIPAIGTTDADIYSEGLANNPQTLTGYYDHLRDEIIKEINTCYTLRGNTNIVSYEDHCIIPKQNGKGYDIFIRMEYLTPLTVYRQSNQLTEQDVIALGMDLCDALALLNSKHILHRDIKPGNIFINESGVYKLGDFGESKVLSNNGSAMSVRGTYSYMSPEISRGQRADIRADLYSVGIVMYRLLNDNKPPFIPAQQPNVTSEQIENSNMRRFKGEALPPPGMTRNQALINIILQACQFDPNYRFATPQAMKNSLLALLSDQKAIVHGNQRFFTAAQIPVTSVSSAAAGKSYSGMQGGYQQQTVKAEMPPVNLVPPPADSDYLQQTGSYRYDRNQYQNQYQQQSPYPSGQASLPDEKTFQTGSVYHSNHPHYASQQNYGGNRNYGDQQQYSGSQGSVASNAYTPDGAGV